MRLRTDDWWTAGKKRAIFLGVHPDPRDDKEIRWDKDYICQLNDDDFEVAQPGDVWRIYWHAKEGVGPLAGYALTCPKESCPEGVHSWTTAGNCSQKDGEGRCPHEGQGSCWEWSGSPEDGTLTANPSLHCAEDRGGCGWHGWLKNGEMSGA